MVGPLLVFKATSFKAFQVITYQYQVPVCTAYDDRHNRQENIMVLVGDYSLSSSAIIH